MTSFLTLSGPGTAETRVRGSTFTAVAAPVEDEAAARAILASREKALWDASHHCSAWVLRSGVVRASDAGEPSGSAGAPILAAIQGAGLTDCAVVVTRYFGGTKLGVGGLVRAYGEAAAAALVDAPRREGVPALRMRLVYGYALTSVVMRTVERAEAAQVEHSYAAGGDAGVVEFSIPAHAATAFRTELTEASGGALEGEILGEMVLYRNAPA